MTSSAARIGEHAIDLCANLFRRLQSAGGSGGKQRVVGHIVPQHVRQATGDFVGAERAQAVLQRCVGRFRSIKKIRRLQHRLDHVANAGSKIRVAVAVKSRAGVE